jgi:hypothetical protein
MSNTTVPFVFILRYWFAFPKRPASGSFLVRGAKLSKLTATVSPNFYLGKYDANLYFQSSTVTSDFTFCDVLDLCCPVAFGEKPEWVKGEQTFVSTRTSVVIK